MLYKNAESQLNSGLHADFFIFGHRHRPVDQELENGSRLIILGDWVTNYTYAEFDGNELILKYFNSN